MSNPQNLSENDLMIIEHVTPIIEKLPRNKPHLAKNMFDSEVWKVAPTVYGERIAFLEMARRLPLRFHETTSSNSRTYWITLE